MDAATLSPDDLDRPVAGHARPHEGTLRAAQTVGEALDSLRSRQLGEKIVYFYVLDAVGGVVGVVPTRRLLMSRPDTSVADIMVRHVVTVQAHATVREAYERLLAHRFLALPVVDEDGRFLGVVDASDLRPQPEPLTWQAADDVFQLIGVHLAEARTTSAVGAFRVRFPWLLCNIGGGIACALLSGLYEATLDTAVVLALFIPIVLALAESVSIQSVTIVLQRLHSARVDRPAFAKALAREFAVAWLLGLASGGLVGLFAAAWKGAFRLAIVIGGSISLSMVSACLLGVALPMAVRAFRGDPKIAAGPIVLATADLVTLLLYFNLAMLLV